METQDISGRIKFLIRFGLILFLVTGGAIGYGVFEHYHATRTIQIENAKVTGTMVSVRTLVNGKVSEFLFEDGDEVKAGDVIARLEVSVTEETIQQLENTVELARSNYEELKKGTWVKVPVIRTRVVQNPGVIVRSEGSANLAALEERANRMKELFEMGAVSAVQRDAAISAYEAEKSKGGYETYSEPSETYVEEIEYVDQLQETPQAVLYGAENAIKQAELSLNVALQEAQQTEIIAPVDGTIYYSAEIDKDLSAGDTIAKVGDSKELWLAAEVSEDVFNKVPLGKLVSYNIDGNNLTGIVIEKIAPDPVEESAEEKPGFEGSFPFENITPENSKIETPSLDIPAPAPAPTENSSTETPPADNSTNVSLIFTSKAEAAEVENSEQPPAAPVENSAVENSTPPEKKSEPSTPKVSENQTDAPPDSMRNDKFILRVSLPAEKNFDCKPNTTTTIKIKL